MTRSLPVAVGRPASPEKKDIQVVGRDDPFMRLSPADPIEHRHRLPVPSLGIIRLVLMAVYCREQRQNMRGFPYVFGRLAC
jgi:hypothetical protein